MNIELKFDYHSCVVYIPDGYIQDVYELQKDFLEWIEDQPTCIIKTPENLLVLSYDEKDFIKYLNDVVLKDSNEKAYFLTKKACITKKKTLNF